MAKGKHSASVDVFSSTKKKRKYSKKQNNTKIDILLKILFFIECIILISSVIYIASMQLLPIKYIVILIVIVSLICGLQAFLKLSNKKKNVMRIISLVLTILVVAGTFWGTGLLNTLYGSFQDFTNDEEVEANVVDVTDESFFVYVSGVDTRNTNGITDKGLSDVNMVIAVDPVNKKILMINTPRDFYVGLYGDENKLDKLTHAGKYGIDCSMETVAAIYDIEFNYYVKANFKALVDLVDAVGDISVDSQYNFSSGHSLSGKTYRFKKGINVLDGDAALAFARERKSFANGDRQRGIHQQMVISAIIDKAISPAILTNFKDILDAVTDNTRTNIKSDDITSLVRMQLGDMSSWDIQSMSVDGTGTQRYTYSYPKQKLYVMLPNDETIEEAKLALKAYK